VAATLTAELACSANRPGPKSMISTAFAGTVGSSPFGARVAAPAVLASPGAAAPLAEIASLDPPWLRQPNESVAASTMARALLLR
jgi:hypothetical protein